jgi:hypothetical protein
MVANYADGDRRRFDCYSAEADALDAADKLARRLDSRDYVAASMTRDQALEYANAVARLKPFNVTVDAATATVAQCLKTVGDLANCTPPRVLRCPAANDRKPVAEVVAELLDPKLEAPANAPRINRRLKRRSIARKTPATSTTDVQTGSTRNSARELSELQDRVTAIQFAVARSSPSTILLKAPSASVAARGECSRPQKSPGSGDAPPALSDFRPALAVGAFAD